MAKISSFIAKINSIAKPIQFAYFPKSVPKDFPKTIARLTKIKVMLNIIEMAS